MSIHCRYSERPTQHAEQQQQDRRTRSARETAAAPAPARRASARADRPVIAAPRPARPRCGAVRGSASSVARARSSPRARASPTSTARAAAGRTRFRTRACAPCSRSSSTNSLRAWCRDVTSESAQRTSTARSMRLRRTIGGSPSRQRRRIPRAADAPCVRPRAALRCARGGSPRSRARVGRIARPTSASGAGGSAAVLMGRRASRGSPPKGCDAARKKRFTIRSSSEWKLMTARRPWVASIGTIAGRISASSCELAIDENPKSLERPRGRILTPITPRARADGLGHDRGQLPRARRRVRPREPQQLLLQSIEQTVLHHSRVLPPSVRAPWRARGTRRPIRRASDPSACRAGRRRETRSRAPDRRSAERKCRGREARRRCARRRARRAPREARRTSSSRRRTADREAASALAAAAGSRSKAKSRPAGASAARIARACPPRPNVASTYVPSGSDRQRGDGFLEQDGDVVTAGSSKAEAVQLGRQSARGERDRAGRRLLPLRVVPELELVALADEHDVMLEARRTGEAPAEPGCVPCRPSRLRRRDRRGAAGGRGSRR